MTTGYRLSEQFGVDHDYSITEEPMTLGSRGRCYTSEDQRHRLGIQGFGYGKHVFVLVRTPITLVGRRATGCRVATAKVRLSQNGEFSIPKAARDHLDVERDDTVVITARRAE